MNAWLGFDTGSQAFGVGHNVGAAGAIIGSLFLGGESELANASKTIEEGSFSITDWSGYPAHVPKPSGPFRLLEGAEYDAARKAANNANKAIHAANPSLKGMQIHEIHPVKFGGSPTSPANKIVLTRAQHDPVTAWWNQLSRNLGGQ